MNLSKLLTQSGLLVVGYVEAVFKKNDMTDKETGVLNVGKHAVSLKVNRVQEDGSLRPMLEEFNTTSPELYEKLLGKTSIFYIEQGVLPAPNRGIWQRMNDKLNIEFYTFSVQSSDKSTSEKQEK